MTLNLIRVTWTGPFFFGSVLASILEPLVNRHAKSQTAYPMEQAHRRRS